MSFSPWHKNEVGIKIFKTKNRTVDPFSKISRNVIIKLRTKNRISVAIPPEGRMLIMAKRKSSKVVTYNMKDEVAEPKAMVNIETSDEMIADCFDDLDELIQDVGVEYEEPKEVCTKTPKNDIKNPSLNTEKKNRPEIPVSHVYAIIKGLPKSVTPKHIDILFGYQDGGKTVRRHLRNKFAEKHSHKGTWIWEKTDKQFIEIVKYFARMSSTVPVQKSIKGGNEGIA